MNYIIKKLFHKNTIHDFFEDEDIEDIEDSDDIDNFESLEDDEEMEYEKIWR